MQQISDYVSLEEAINRIQMSIIRPDDEIGVSRICPICHKTVVGVDRTMVIKIGRCTKCDHIESDK